MCSIYKQIQLLVGFEVSAVSLLYAAKWGIIKCPIAFLSEYPTTPWQSNLYKCILLILLWHKLLVEFLKAQF